ncbi:hypothetical protein [Moraxella porci]|uniref:hypothetical protein n=1 Tax=Moraxella porci TaxID=1288392 RepID=UPI00244802AB|nr:hypothetical protein [Moraxella porci]MDH2273101.1 hypothetical protein [Moraxella porci]
MTTVSFLILEKRSRLIEKHRFKKYTFSKIEKGFYIFYREYSNGVINKDMSLNDSYIEFIKDLSKEIECTIYFLIKNIKHQEAVDNFSIDNYLSECNKKNIQELNIDHDNIVGFDKPYKFSYSNEWQGASHAP